MDEIEVVRWDNRKLAGSSKKRIFGISGGAEEWS